MNKEEIALRLTELYGKFHNITTTNETRFTDIYNIMLENINYENNSKEQIEEYQKALDETMSKNIDLQQRIDKAIEYIDKHKENEYRNGRNDEIYLELNEKELKELLKILKGKE